MVLGLFELDLVQSQVVATYELVLDCNLELEVQILVVDSAGLALFLKQCLRKKPSVKQGQHHQH